MEREQALLANYQFEQGVSAYLRNWARSEDEGYLSGDALRDFFLLTPLPLQALLKQGFMAGHLGRDMDAVCFDAETGDPILSRSEQRIYNLIRRMDSELLHIPFRSVQPNKQTEAGDIADTGSYPVDSDLIRYNSGNHFSSRPANMNVFEENSRRCSARTENNVFVLFRRGFLEERLQDIKAITAAMHEAGETQAQFFVICSRHSAKEGHFGASLVVMDPLFPDFPRRVLICDTLLKELPHHPRWWNYFVTEYANVFGDGIIEMLEDLSHPLQKVNVKGDDPYQHDWDCPYYVASMTDALTGLAKATFELVLRGSTFEIHEAMKGLMPDYYDEDNVIKDRQNIRMANRFKRWNSGREVILNLFKEPLPIAAQLFKNDP